MDLASFEAFSYLQDVDLMLQQNHTLPPPCKVNPVKTAIQEADEPDENDKKRHHCWAAAGHNFKSDIYFYEVPTNSNGKMSQKISSRANSQAYCRAMD